MLAVQLGCFAHVRALILVLALTAGRKIVFERVEVGRKVSDLAEHTDKVDRNKSSEDMNTRNYNGHYPRIVNQLISGRLHLEQRLPSVFVIDGLRDVPSVVESYHHIERNQWDV